jgi:hypothetical protein
MIVFKIVLALLSLGAFCVLFHYLNWEIHNGEFDAKWRNHKAYVLFLLFGFILVAYGGAMNIMFFIPDSWFDDEYGDATGVKEGIAGMVAFGSLVLLDSFKKLSESSANEVYLKNELEKTKQNYLEDISRMNSDHNAKYTEIENETLELKKDLEFKTKKCEFLPGLYHDTKAFHIQEISHINQISNTWTIINREFTEKSLSDLSAKTANLETVR